MFYPPNFLPKCYFGVKTRKRHDYGSRDGCYTCFCLRGGSRSTQSLDIFHAWRASCSSPDISSSSIAYSRSGFDKRLAVHRSVVAAGGQIYCTGGDFLFYCTMDEHYCVSRLISSLAELSWALYVFSLEALACLQAGTKFGQLRPAR